MTTPELDGIGRVIDFGAIKSIIQDWIDLYWDHNMILNPNDPLANHPESLELVGRPCYLMPPSRSNPTAEHMAKELADRLTELIAISKYPVIRITKIVLWETPNCCAIWERAV
jgi:6-pyruvoyltetrahydropterin/6-carboxytetrahydropterin synthase